MRKAFLLIVSMLLLLWLVPGCLGTVAGSGDLETREFDFLYFYGVRVDSAFEAVLRICITSVKLHWVTLTPLVAQV